MSPEAKQAAEPTDEAVAGFSKIVQALAKREKTMTPEAKQAAERLLSDDEWQDGSPAAVAAVIQEAIDAATAKLRKELEIMTRSRDAWQQTAARMSQNCADRDEKLAKLRKQFRRTQTGTSKETKQ